MIPASALTRLSPVLWEIPRSHRADMRVPARVFAAGRLLDDILQDRSLEQLVNVAALPGIQGAAYAMPDVHEGYGFPIGGVAATEHPDGAISPGGIGYDINCGVRLLTSRLRAENLVEDLGDLAKALYRAVPSGVGQGGSVRLARDEMDRVLRDGMRWAVDRGYASAEELPRVESQGRLAEADPACVSDRAKERGRDQLGTMGSGNHFVEVDRVDEIGDELLAQAFGLFPEQVVLLVHCGSRGLGHQVATDHIRRMMPAMARFGIRVPDRELACAPFSSTEGRDYYHAMAAAANFGWANRQVITGSMRKAWREVLGARAGELSLLYDVSHNLAKLETHRLDGRERRLILHRKGATRAFGPGHPETGEPFRDTGQPVLIPGSMGTASYVLAGAEGSLEHSFGSCCHGAGRRLSRMAAKRRVHGRELVQELLASGIRVEAGSWAGVAEEAPIAYKDVDRVVEVVERAGLARRVARLTPLAVIKG